jgi:glycosyltransferase involved in cell wall biosynthesis
LKLLVIGTVTPPFNGQSIAFEQLTNHLGDQKDIETTVLPLPSNKNKLAFIFLSVVYIFKLLYYIPKSDIVYLQCAQSFKGLLRDMPVVLLAKLFNCSTVVHCHGGNFDRLFCPSRPIAGGLANFVYRRVDIIIILAENLRQMFSHDANLMKKCVVVANGLSVAAPQLLEKQTEATYKILYLSNLYKEKGYLDVLEAMLILKQRGRPEVELHIAGAFLPVSQKQQDMQYFNDFLLRHDLTNVTYHGVKVGDDKWGLIAACDIFILPTYYENEGQPISIIEAMAYGLPVITTDFRGIPSLVEHEVSGLFVETKDPAGIADAIIQLIDSEQLFDDIRANAFKKYQSSLTSESHSDAVMHVLNKLHLERVCVASMIDFAMTLEGTVCFL